MDTAQQKTAEDLLASGTSALFDEEHEHCRHSITEVSTHPIVGVSSRSFKAPCSPRPRKIDGRSPVGSPVRLTSPPRGARKVKLPAASLYVERSLQVINGGRLSEASSLKSTIIKESPPHSSASMSSTSAGS